MASKRQLKKIKLRTDLKREILEKELQLKDIGLNDEISRLQKKIKEKKKTIKNLKKELEALKLIEKDLSKSSSMFKKDLTIGEFQSAYSKAQNDRISENEDAAESYAYIKEYHDLVDQGFITPNSDVDFNKYAAKEFLNKVLSFEEIEEITKAAEEKKKVLTEKANEITRKARDEAQRARDFFASFGLG